MHEARAERVGGPCRSRSAASSVALLLAACGGTGATSNPTAPGAPGGSPGESPPARFERIICPQCVEAGGETTDFGDGSAFVPTGAGIFAAPTPCELSETVSNIELEAARELGFGALLDRLDMAFDLPFEWSPNELELERPARGYSPHTRVRGTLTAVSAEHYLPSLEGCPDSLRVRVATTLQTDDGALSISGTLATKIAHEQRFSTIHGYLDLSQARGTLEIDPPPSSETVFGYVNSAFFAWPDGVRLQLSIGAMDPRDIGADVLTYDYQPLHARGPFDHCSAYSWPLAFDDATPSVGPGESLADRFPELLSLITTPQPFSASWMGGAQTTLEIDVGEPFALCDQAPGLWGRVPYRVRSGDGRVDIESEADTYISFIDGKLGAGYFEIYRDGPVLPAESFAENTGISGVDFGEYGGGLWHTVLLFDPAATFPLSGEVVVDGVNLDSFSIGLPSGIVDSIDSLGW